VRRGHFAGAAGSHSRQYGRRYELGYELGYGQGYKVRYGSSGQRPAKPHKFSSGTPSIRKERYEVSKQKTLNRHLVARRLSEAIHGGQLPGPVAAEAVGLIAKIDANEGGIGAATKSLVSDAWASTARAVAGGAKVSQLRAVLELEESLGLQPRSQVEAPAEAAAEEVAKTDDDTDDGDVAEVAPVSAAAPAPAWSQS
jgi:hypothetical protein